MKPTLFKFFVLIAIVFTCTLCSIPYSGMIVDVSLLLTVSDPNGNDLLDTTNANAYELDSIKLYRLLPDGTPKLVYNANWSVQNGFRIYTDSKPVIMDIFLDDEFADSSTTLIYWNAQDIDTVYATFYHHKNLHYIDELYYNGVLKADSYVKRGNEEVRLNIVKNR